MRWLRADNSEPVTPEFPGDTKEITERRIKSKFVMYKGDIHCITCVYFDPKKSWCNYEANNYPCDGSEGCCEYWKNNDAKMWEK